MNRDRPPPASWRTTAALALLAGALGVAVLVEAEKPTAGQNLAAAIERGMASAETPPVDAEALEDERLTGDANEAGYRWAERRGLTMRADCTNFSKAFRDGCADYVEDQAGQ